jgi:hypothetical protein
LISTFLSAICTYIKLMLSVCGFYEMHWSMGSWIRGFKHYRQQLMGQLYFARF